MSPNFVCAPNTSAYDYHAAKLERFLEEYRTLQKELTKMKETCDNLKTDRSSKFDFLTPSPSEDGMSKSIPNNSPASVDSSFSNTPIGMGIGNFDSDLNKYMFPKCGNLDK